MRSLGTRRIWTNSMLLCLTSCLCMASFKLSFSSKIAWRVLSKNMDTLDTSWYRLLGWFLAMPRYRKRSCCGKPSLLHRHGCQRSGLAQFSTMVWILPSPQVETCWNRVNCSLCMFANMYCCSMISSPRSTRKIQSYDQSSPGMIFIAMQQYV